MRFKLSTLFFALILAISACTDFQEEHSIPSGLSVGTETLSFSEDASTHTVIVKSGSKWRINSIPEWIQVQSIENQSAFRYEWPVTFSAQSNSGYNRKGTISIGTADESIAISVEQKGKKGAYVAVESVSINKDEMTLTKGESQKLTASIRPSSASEKSVKWSSSNTAVATVSSDGLVTAIEVGTATISVTTDDGNKTATCTVTVTPVTVNGVSLNKTTLSLIVGDSETLTATVSPSNAANKNVTWSSSNTNVATVDSNGKVTAIAVGSTTVTVTTNDGGKKATCSVTVNPITVTGISLDKTSISLKIGDSQTLSASIIPSNATNKSVTWSSSNTSIATVNSYGKVTAFAVGSATITVTTKDGGKTATCSVTVNPITVTGISLSQSNITLTVGDTQTLTATISPSNATDKSVTWTSSNTSVAIVSSDGVVTAKAAGTATIIATTNDGGKKATCTVTVQEKVIAVTGVSLNKTSLSMTEGDTHTLTATVTPSNATDKSVTWTSSDNSVATVSTDGVVTAKAAGTATITATTNDGGKIATCTVTVQEKTIAVTGVSLNKTSLSLVVGDTQTLSATISPSNATNKSVTWISSNNSVATVSTDGVVTAKAAGTATITVTTNDGGKKATCSVSVQEKSIAVTGVSLNKTSLSLIVGDTQTLTATISPSNATDKSVTWTSSNTYVATVSATGVVTAKAAGTATITVKTSDGGKTATCSVTVKSKDITGSGNEGTGEEELF